MIADADLHACHRQLTHPFVAARIASDPPECCSSLFSVLRCYESDQRPCPWRTNGGLPRAQAASLPRISTSTVLRRAGRHARQRDRALQRGRERAAGDLPRRRRPRRTRWCERITARSSSTSPTSCRSAPRARAASSAARPMKSRSAGSKATVHARPTLERMRALVHVVAIQIHAGLEPQRVARAEAAGAHAARVQHAPQAAASLGGQHDLEAVLAGVAGARDEPVAERAPHEWAERERGRAQSPAAAAPRLSRAPPGPARPASPDRVRSVQPHVEAAPACERDPGEVLVARAGVDDQAKPVLGRGNRRSGRRGCRRPHSACSCRAPCRGS